MSMVKLFIKCKMDKIGPITSNQKERIEFLISLASEINSCEKVKNWILQHSFDDDKNEEANAGSSHNVHHDKITFENGNEFDGGESIWNCSTVPVSVKRKEVVKAYICFHCGLSTQVKKYLENHVKMEHIKKKLTISSMKCNKSKIKTSSDKNVNIMKQKSTGLKSRNVLDKCENGEDNEFRKHINGTFKCNECDYKATTRHNLKLHSLAKHSDIKPYVCSFCTYSSVTSSHLKRHVIAKHIKSIVKCSYCYFSTNKNEDLITHRKKVHEKSCPQCNYTTCKENSLREHIKAIHLALKPFACNKCHYRTVRARDLELHKLSKHTKNRPFPCQECNFSAATQWKLKNHVSVKHLNSKPFVCTKCSYASSVLCNLKRHQMAKHKLNLNESSYEESKSKAGLKLIHLRT